MKVTIALTLAAAIVASAWGQEKLPLEEAQKGARLVTKALGDDVPLKMELELEDPYGFKAGEGAILVIPSKSLSRKALAQSAKEGTPVGQLWMLKLSPTLNSKVIPSEKIRWVTIKDDGNEAKIQVFFLASKRNEKGGFDLVVYSQDKQPLLQVPMETMKADQEFPIELKGQKRDDDSGILTLNILGEYKAELLVMKRED